jgi:hypothetical protein
LYIVETEGYFPSGERCEQYFSNFSNKVGGNTDLKSVTRSISSAYFSLGKKSVPVQKPPAKKSESVLTSVDGSAELGSAELDTDFSPGGDQVTRQDLSHHEKNMASKQDIQRLEKNLTSIEKTLAIVLARLPPPAALDR